MPKQKSLNNKYNKIAISLAVICNLFLILLKLFAYIKTDSLSLFSSLMDSSLDLTVSTLNLIALLYALKPADDDHRFGHHSAEDIAVLAQSTFIFASGAFIIFEGIRRITDPHPIENPNIGIFVIIGSALFSGAIALIQKTVAKKTGSQIVAADSIHYVSDLLIGLSIATSILLASRVGGAWIDPTFAMFIGLYMIFASYKPGKKAVDNLMDHEIGDKEKELITNVLSKYKKIVSCKNLRTRQSGNQRFFYLDLVFLDQISLQKADEIAKKITDEIEKTTKDIELIIVKSAQ